tara:strand:+ start:153 stop:1073 length:921 start_codon:yes stop_codon:yes gene_type:complete
MKILLTLNKTLDRKGVIRLDSAFYNVYIPLMKLGHEVELYDTVNPIEKDFEKVVAAFQPELIFSCATGNKNVTPYEPLDQIKSITSKGNVKTFNWFCDDTWRFETFSKDICKNFLCCSTPEPSFIDEYKRNGYSNIILGSWHCSSDLFLGRGQVSNAVGFVGGLTQDRKERLDFLASKKLPVLNFGAPSYEDMIAKYSSCSIGINFSVNSNCPNKSTQMKLRVMEIANSESLIFSEYTPQIENLFKIDKEIIIFKSNEEMEDKIRYYLKNHGEREKVCRSGRRRFLAEHESQTRLASILKSINKFS